MTTPTMHPIVERLSPSEEQRPAIAARGRDVLVTAGAGTGKTRTLVARFLSLLAEGVPLRSIVAVTFTRKAAREMRNRVRQAIGLYLRELDATAAEHGRWQQLYSDIDAARIGTIHSLCTEILRFHPVEALVDPRFDVLDEATSGILRNRALDEAMAAAADDAELATLFTLLGERDLRGHLGTLLHRRLDVHQALEQLPQDVLAHWRRRLSERQQRALQQMVDHPLWGDSVMVLEQNVADRDDDRLEQQRQAALLGIAAVQRGDIASPHLAGLRKINLSGGSAKAWSGGLEQLRTVKAGLRAVRECWKQHDPAQWRCSALDEQLAQALSPLRAIADLAVQVYNDSKQQQNLLDFDDLEQRALDLLRDCPTVLEYWRSQVKALLVDEFQDTNGRQRDLIRLLNGEAGRLFAVGDAKQSIYRFRGADVTVFRSERARVERGGYVCELRTSYRAHCALVKGLNDLLRPVLGASADLARPWVAPFAELLHHREDAGPGFEPPHIEFQLALGTKNEGALECAAQNLAAKLVPLVEGPGHAVIENDQPRALHYGDIAILCRASTSFQAYENALDGAGIPYVTVAGRGFYDRPEIRDLLNALRALADPSDDAALVGLLRSPACAWSDVDLYRLCQQREQSDESASLWDTLRQDGSHAADDRRQRAVELVEKLNGLVGRTTLADVLKAFLDDTSYVAALLQADQARAARNVAKLLADAHASGIVGVGEFVEHVQSLRDVGVREGEARSIAEGAVQIMTVHAAKGLEFAIVVIGDITHQGGSGKPALVDSDLGILLPLSDEDKGLPGAYSLAKEQEDDQEGAESDRLLYVAATRAREKLILNGSFQLGHTLSEGNWLGRIMAAHGLTPDWAEIDLQGEQALQIPLQLGQAAMGCTIYTNGFTLSIPEHRREPAAQPGIVPPPPLLAVVEATTARMDTQVMQQERDAPQRVWRVVPAVQEPTAPAWVVGKLVHESLASWRFPDASPSLWMEARARELGIIDVQQLQDAARRATKLLQRFRAHALYREMDSAQRRLHEVPYSMLVQGQDERGVIDALYLQQGTWTVVEFKTDRVRDAAELQVLLGTEDYAAQMSRYVSAVERLVGQRPRAVLCMLDLAGEVHTMEL